MQAHPLPEGFDFQVLHHLRFTLDAGQAELLIDDTRVTAAHPIPPLPERPGRVGLAADRARASFDGVVFTPGWDEYDGRIRGWRAPDATGTVTGGERGLELDARGGERLLLKGDPMPAYEFTVQVMPQGPDTARAGICPVYVDEKNWLIAEIDPRGTALTVRGMKDGQPAGPWTAPLAERARIYEYPLPPSTRPGVRLSASHCWKLDSTQAAGDGIIPPNSQNPQPKHCFWDHQGGTEWLQYDFDAPRTVNACEVLWYDDSRSNGGCRVPASWRVLYRKGEAWEPVRLEPGERYGTEIDVLHAVRFAPVQTSALRLEVQQQAGFGSGVYEWTFLEADEPGRPLELDLHLKRPSFVTGLEMDFDPAEPNTPPVGCDLFYPDAQGQWQPVQPSGEQQGVDRMAFAPVLADRLRARIYVKPGGRARLIQAHARVEGQPSRNLRAVKLADRVLLMIDGKQKLEIPGVWPPSQVGLTAQGTQAVYNGILCFQIDPAAGE
jgi:hypothetical protein